MKRLILTAAVFLIFTVFLTSCRNIQPEEASDSPTATEQTACDKNFKAFVWVNYYELSMEKEGGGTAEAFAEKVKNIFTAAKNAGIDAAIVQLRPFCDAFYKSEIFPWSKYLTGTQGGDPGYDPLAIMCREAREAGLEIHGWINPYRVLYSADTSLLSENSPYFLLKKENLSNIIETESGLFLNPASPSVKKLVLDGVREILQYSLDGIHMDDYFYPSAVPEIDKSGYEEYTNLGGDLPLDEWRREHVNSLVAGIYSLVKEKSPDTLFGISPAGDIEKNLNSHYADVRLWCSRSGYIDYIMPQLYYGFKNEKMPFSSVAEEWSELVKDGSVQLYAGLAAYKCGKEDVYAGSGRAEWQEDSEILLRQTKNCLELGFDGVSVYSYQSIAEQGGEMQSLFGYLIQRQYVLSRL